MGIVHWTDQQIEDLNQFLASLKRNRRHSQLPFGQSPSGPIEFRVGKADAAISVGGTGTISLWRRMPDEDGVGIWQDSDEDVEAHDWMDVGPFSTGEKVYLHRQADAMGALWIIGTNAADVYGGIYTTYDTVGTGIGAFEKIALNTAMPNRGVTVDTANNQLVIVSAGDYWIDFNGTDQWTGAGTFGANILLYQNGAVAGFHTARSFDIGPTDNMPFSWCGILTLAAGDTLALYAALETATGQSLYNTMLSAHLLR